MFLNPTGETTRRRHSDGDNVLAAIVADGHEGGPREVLGEATCCEIEEDEEWACAEGDVDLYGCD